MVKKSISELRRELALLQRPKHYRNTETERLRLQVAIANAKGPLARTKAGYRKFRATGGISGISTRAQLGAELKARKYLGKEFHLFKKAIGLHSNPTAFIAMMNSNTRMTDRQKQKAFKTYVRHHKRK
jgi:hypothetical protein